jgi:hypothetical protein
MLAFFEYNQIDATVNDWDALLASDEIVYHHNERKFWTMLLLGGTAFQTTLWSNKLCLLPVYKHFM